MEIRGIDFSRHSITLGSSEGDAPSAQTGGAAAAPRGEMSARVLAVAGSEAAIDLNGQRVVVESHVPLNVGDKLTVQVAAAQNGQIRLAILQAESADDPLSQAVNAGDDLDTLIHDLGLPTDDRTRQAARALIARDGTLERGPLANLLGQLRAFPNVSEREAGAGALLQKANVPVTPETVALIAERAEPGAPPQLSMRLATLQPALETLKRQLPPRSPLAPIVDDLLDLLKGLPLDEKASSPQVQRALKQWVAKLQPGPQPGAATPQSTPLPSAPREGVPSGRTAQAPAAQAATPAAADPVASDPLADASLPLTPPAQDPADPSAPTALSAGAEDPQATAPAAPQTSSSTASQTPAPSTGAPAQAASPHETAGAKPGLLPVAPDAAAQPATAAQPAGRPDTPALQATPERAPQSAPAREARVPLSQQIGARVGITTKAPSPAGADLASMLEKLNQGLGSDQKGLKKSITEAVAEVRYTQLVNTPSPQEPPTGQTYLVPLLLPELSPDSPEGRIQIYQRPARPGEPIDPNNVRLVVVLDTEHLGTVQTEVSVREAVLDLSIGVPKGEDSSFLANHLGQLEQAIAKLGWQTGRFGTRVAKKLPPKLPQEEGLQNVVRVDLRV